LPRLGMSLGKGLLSLSKVKTLVKFRSLTIIYIKVSRNDKESIVLSNSLSIRSFKTCLKTKRRK